MDKRHARNRYWRILPVFFALTALAQNNPAPPSRPILATPPEPAWKSKQISEWTEDDAKQVIANSPWVKNFFATLGSAPSGQARRPMIGMGGIGIGGIGMGVPGMGRRMGGGGYPQGGGYPGGSDPSDQPRITLRWESAMPIRTAELKAHDNNAPVIDDKHYAIAVYGVPGRYLVAETTKKLESELKKTATLRRDGKKDIKPTSVDVIDKPSGMVVVYEFSTSHEITKDDRRVEFNAKMGRLLLDQSFFLDDMVWQGKREL